MRVSSIFCLHQLAQPAGPDVARKPGGDEAPQQPRPGGGSGLQEDPCGRVSVARRSTRSRSRASRDHHSTLSSSGKRQTWVVTRGSRCSKPGVTAPQLCPDHLVIIKKASRPQARGCGIRPKPSVRCALFPPFSEDFNPIDIMPLRLKTTLHQSI